MPEKINPFHLPRPKRATETREFSADGEPFTVTFRAPDAADMNMASEVAKRLCADYLTGYPEEGTLPAEFFDGIKVSESLFLIAAAGQEMQPPEKRLYTAEELIVLMDRRPDDGVEIARWVNDLLSQWKSRRGNSSGVPTEPSSAAHSTPLTSTQNPSSEPTFSGPVSMPAWEPSAENSAPTIPATT